MLTTAPALADETGVDRAVHDALGRIAFAPRRPVIVALSGGGDSTALVHITHAFVRSSRADVPLIAATVDHGLRPESADEARAVARSCADFGVRHVTERWADRPATGLQQAARLARYRLLTDLARCEGASIVLTGHTADDQAETLAMRRARATDGPGLAGIDEATLSERAVWFARPLLETQRTDLRAWLSARSIGWLDDPSNRDPSFERVRVRAALKPADRAALNAEASRRAERRRALARAGAACLNDRLVWRMDDGALTVDPAGIAAHGTDARIAAMAAALAWTGRLEHQPPTGHAERALAFCAEAESGAALTIAGCLMRKRDRLVRLVPEARNRRSAAMRGFDRLLPAADWPLAAALARLHGAALYPPPPFTNLQTIAAH
ncbi:tRNA lysidine(34) synthetase TilS [Roseitalea porphyridii]|uniref:tRNA(Ile)-lysidine synthase n=1 Tax=Roseitalea porphyridii TaxID=1852022 RepID=A0A4P6V561_9HYPH|nr:tRNA lysidine(34) synthetase TilS [Roseitalea porphyridii]QBK31720.1 tRNA lysidine(34) synthetase TilS [Roseitalea porphyridii]